MEKILFLLERLHHLHLRRRLLPVGLGLEDHVINRVLALLGDEGDLAGDAGLDHQLVRDDVVLGDVAGAEPSDFSRLFTRLSAQPAGPAAVLAPSRDGGTSALLRRPAQCMPACFGPQSAARHREAAAAAGVPIWIEECESLALDLDQVEDVERFVQTNYSGLRTRALLDQLGWSPLDEGEPR